MAFKFIAAFALFIAAASAGLVPAQQVYHAAPAHLTYAAAPVSVVKSTPVHYAAQPLHAKHDDEFDPHPQYKYAYDVQDSISGDSKSQHEERDGDVVRGEYSLIDADGFKRTVHYTADDHNGFNAVVSREPLVKVAHYAAPAVVKSVAPVAHYAAPAYTSYSAPAAYASHGHHH